MVNAPSVVREAEKVLGDDIRWYMQEYQHIKNMPNEAKKIADDLHKHASSRNDFAQFSALVHQYHQLVNDERWELFRVGFSRLTDVIKRLLKLPLFDDPPRKNQKKELTRLTSDEEILKSMLLNVTAIKLKPLVEGKKLQQITIKDWERIAELTKQLVTDINALILTTTRMEKIIEEATGVKI